LAKCSPSKLVTDGVGTPVFCAIDAEGNPCVTNLASPSRRGIRRRVHEAARATTKGLTFSVGIAIDRFGNLYVANWCRCFTAKRRGGRSRSPIASALPTAAARSPSGLTDLLPFAREARGDDETLEPYTDSGRDPRPPWLSLSASRRAKLVRTATARHTHLALLPSREPGVVAARTTKAAQSNAVHLVRYLAARGASRKGGTVPAGTEVARRRTASRRRSI
jgi:hypothetical protein